MRAIRLFALVSGLVLAAPIARAEEGPKDPDTAFWLSAGGALTSVVLVGAGGGLAAAANTHQGLSSAGNAMLDIGIATSVVSPMIGHWYSHHYLTAGLGLRVAGAAFAGIANVHVCGFDANDYGGCPHPTNYGAIVFGALIYASGMLSDVATAKREALAYNRDHAPHAMIVPTALRGASSTGYGVAVGGSF